MNFLKNLASKLSALALFFFCLYLLAVYGAGPIMKEHRLLDEQIAQAQHLAKRFAQERDGKEAYEARIEEVRQSQISVGSYLAGETSAVAGADLQQRVKAAVASSGGQLKSTQILPQREVNGFSQIGLRLALVGTIDSFFDLIYGLESSGPYLFVDNLDIKARRSRRRQNEEDKAPQLTIRLDLYGYLQPEAGT